MYYKMIHLENDTIEFINNWLGKETIKVNGQTVSEKFSLSGIDHEFTITEGGEPIHYLLTTKINDNMQVGLDIRRNGHMLMENVIAPMNFSSKGMKSPLKKSGVIKIKQYDIVGGLKDLKASLKVNARDPEVYFFMACGHSIQENVNEGFECLRKAVEYNLQDTDIISDHEMLAYLRVQGGYEEFVASKFTEYDLEEE